MISTLVSALGQRTLHSLDQPSPRVRTRRFIERDQGDLPCPVLTEKIFLFSDTPNQRYKRRRLIPQEGRRPSSRTLGWDAVDAAASGANEIAGRLAVSGHRAPDERRYFRPCWRFRRACPPKPLAKADGCVRQNRVVPAPVAGVKLPVATSIQPDRLAIKPVATVTRRIRRRGERDISRKAIAQGMSECFR
jgi:hypothetical protein